MQNWGEPDEPDELPNGGILYLLEDMRELELYGSVCAVVSVCDSMNYILEEADLREVFSRVHEYLEEDGVFIFDLNTVYKYRDLIRERRRLRKTVRRAASSCGRIISMRRVP